MNFSVRYCSTNNFFYFIFFLAQKNELRKSSFVKKCNWLSGLLSGINASEEAQNDLIRGETLGRKQKKELIDDCIKQNKADFYCTVKKNKLKTFCSLKPIKRLHSIRSFPVCQTTCSPRKATSNDSDHVFFIKDQYWNDSIKSCERNRRSNTGSIRMTAAWHEQKLLKQMKK